MCCPCVPGGERLPISDEYSTESGTKWSRETIGGRPHSAAFETIIVPLAQEFAEAIPQDVFMVDFKTGVKLTGKVLAPPEVSLVKS